jgi:hypothetical protein
VSSQHGSKDSGVKLTCPVGVDDQSALGLTEGDRLPEGRDREHRCHLLQGGLADDLVREDVLDEQA